MFYYQIVSNPEREHIYAELFIDNTHFGEIVVTDDRKGMEVVIFPDEESYFKFDYTEFTALLTAAAKELWERLTSEKFPPPQTLKARKIPQGRS